MRIILAAALLAGRAMAGAPAPAVQTERRQLREGLQGSERRLKQVTIDQRKERRMLLERERSDLRLVKASAAQPETMHADILAVHEKSRRDRLALRARAREERDRLRRAIKDERDRIVSLRRKK